MLDIKILREDPDGVKQALGRRGQAFDFAPLLGWDGERRAIIADIDALRARRNAEAEQVGKLKREGKEPAPELVAEMEGVRNAINEKERALVPLEEQIEQFLLSVPNIPDDSVPQGAGEADNKLVRQTGTAPAFDFKPRAHWEIGEKLGILDFNTAAKISGARFSMLRGMGCVLERALISFMLDTHRANGYAEVMVPYLVNRASMRGTGQLPKFEDELFRCPADELYLIPTAEVPVTNIHRDEMLDEKDLPKKYVCYTACFRREAGSYGKDTRGLIRNHQFNKIEIVKFSKPEDSMTELEALTRDAGAVLEKLGLAYRVVELCTADLGFSSSKTYDLEVWMPSENRWREISSCSNFKDFQARRLNARVKYADKRKDYLHTLNGSGVAVGRCFAAILENCQQKDGSVVIPEALRKYTGFERITA